MIKALLLDMDGLLIHREEYFSKRSGLPLDKVNPFFNGVFQECLVGRADLKQELEKVYKDWGWVGSLDELIDFWFQGERTMDEEMFNYVRMLRRKGIKVFVGTNNEKYRMNYLIKELHLEDQFDKIYASGFVGYKKPSKEFFEHILSNQNLKPQDIVFWDDKLSYMDGARQIGLHVEEYTNFEDFEKTMEKYLSNIDSSLRSE